MKPRHRQLRKQGRRAFVRFRLRGTHSATRLCFHATREYLGPTPAPLGRVPAAAAVGAARVEDDVVKGNALLKRRARRRLAGSTHRPHKAGARLVRSTTGLQGNSETAALVEQTGGQGGTACLWHAGSDGIVNRNQGLPAAAAKRRRITSCQAVLGGKIQRSERVRFGSLATIGTRRNCRGRTFICSSSSFIVVSSSISFD